MRIDFHSHIMPAFDDGAKDAKMSIAMLQKSMDQGVETVVSTSHCYPMSGRDITEFTDKRQTAYNVLMEAVKADNAEIPKLVPAAEVHLSCVTDCVMRPLLQKWKSACRRGAPTGKTRWSNVLNIVHRRTSASMQRHLRKET